ncbi:O-fucosyltransferase 36 [Vitis vinifera]|uniref:O-fucosyltransferase family protein n=1 Tax=Vitis vinifera TaxID=29760 RepID=A0A438K6S1_VITVI|nr:O-fucosyltransferase 36 [Vitis vinifera]
MERESSDDEEDRQNLIDENERKLPHRSGFQIEDFKSRLSAHRFSFNKRYLFAIFPPLFILLIYFTTDVLLSSADFKSALLKQISLNKEIQQVLLSSHPSGNLSELVDDNGDLNFVAYSFNRCPKVNQNMSQRPTIEWKPRSDKVICYFSLPLPCYVDDDHVKKLKSLGISMGKLEPAWAEDIKKPKKRTAQDVQAKFSSNDDVIAIGDVFYANVEEEWVMQPGGPLAHKCQTLIEPSRLIMLTAQRFVQTFLGKSFTALHFRRHGFLKFCNAKEPSCFFPIPQAADCISRVVERADTPVIYLSTDAAESETGLLQSLVVLNGKLVPLIKRPTRNSAEKWDALLYRHGLDGDSQDTLKFLIKAMTRHFFSYDQQSLGNTDLHLAEILRRMVVLEEIFKVEAMLDKTICAMASVFIGAPGSTFTEDILRLRRGWGSASHCDEYLCQGEQPNFIADNE